jgi:dolichol-phosphate mannosyltransferase
MAVLSNILVFTPTFNERTNIVVWLRRVSAVMENAHLLIVDDSSTDGTTDILRNWMAKDSKLTIHIRPKKNGIGSAHAWAVKYAFENGFDYLIAMDADLSHDPEDIPRLCGACQEANYVVATRNRSKGGKNELPRLRRLWSFGANLLCRTFLPTGLTEYTTSFRCYDREAMKTLVKRSPKNEGYSFFIEVTETMFQSNLKLREVPIVFHNRKFEQSKIPKMQIFISAGTILHLIVKRLLVLNQKKR